MQFYQIYPRSFKDSNNDGIGDLRGIIQKLPYLKDLGVTATWLSPILKSPQVDYGYDISDFKIVDPMFGTNEELEELFREAKLLGIKVIMDFVPNHTSDKHEWFIKSVEGDPEFKDYYVWHDGVPNGDGRPLPPNNWVNINQFNNYKCQPNRYCYCILSKQFFLLVLGLGMKSVKLTIFINLRAVCKYLTIIRAQIMFVIL